MCVCGVGGVECLVRVCLCVRVCVHVMDASWMMCEVCICVTRSSSHDAALGIFFGVDILEIYEFVALTF